MKAMKADLHVHSKFSRRPSYWVLQKLGAAECYIRPSVIYDKAKAKGMTFVTISDHNSIAGSLEIAHLPDTFISEEITTYFPDNGCKIHVLALNITEVDHDEIQKIRENIYDLVQYLSHKEIVHVVAHPLYAINDRLTTAHFERLLLLFNNFELNGTRDGYQNAVLSDILSGLSPDYIDTLADRHNIAPVGPTPWKKNLTGGSDDHSGNHIAGIYTAVDGRGSIDDFLRGINRGKGRARGKTYTPRMMAHTFYSIAYQYYRSKFSLGRLKSRDVFFAFFDNLLSESGNHAIEAGAHEKRNNLGSSIGLDWHQNPVFSNVCIQTARDVLINDVSYKRIACGEIIETDKKIAQCFRFVNQAAEEVITRISNTALKNISTGNIFDVFAMLGAGGALYTMLAPYFLSYNLFTKDRQFCRNIRDIVLPEQSTQDRLNVAHFTDTLMDINGVARTLRMQAQIASKIDRDLTMITCGPETGGNSIKTFAPIGAFEVPEYSELKLYYPPLLKMIDYCYEKDFNRIHVATPGPVGLAALAIARILKLPVYGTYHTELPEYVTQLTGDTSLEDLMWKYVIWFYNQMDVVFVPSHATGEKLICRGIHPEKIMFYKRGVDTAGFHPSKRNGFFKRRFNLDDRQRKLLYVGRVSREKNVDQLIDILIGVIDRYPDTCLVIVGDGPYLETMKSRVAGLPVLFTGFMEGGDLKEAFASSDIFVFPSTTDTFGNVVLEAQASGIPVVVSDKGGPKENLIPGETGFIVCSGDTEAFVKKINLLLSDDSRLGQMKKNARAYMEGRGFESAFKELWDVYQKPVSGIGGMSMETLFPSARGG